MRARVGDADARRPPYVADADGGAGEDAERAAYEIRAVLAARDVEGLAERAGTAAQTPRGRVRKGPAASHEVETGHGLEGADEHGLGCVSRLRHHVHAVVNAVHEVDVRMARRAVHRLVPRGAMAAAAVRGAIAGTPVGLDLDDPSRGATVGTVVHQDLAQQRASHAERRLEVEAPGQGAPGHAPFSFFTSSVSSGTALKRSATSP